jgi:son of sevenless
LRLALQQAMPNPAVPFIGVYLTELTFIEDGNPNFITNSSNKKLINFYKRRLYSDTILNIQLYQQTPYHFQSVPYLEYILTYDLFKDLSSWDDKQMYKESLIIEPRS